MALHGGLDIEGAAGGVGGEPEPLQRFLGRHPRREPCLGPGAALAGLRHVAAVGVEGLDELGDARLQLRRVRHVGGHVGAPLGLAGAVGVRRVEDEGQPGLAEGSDGDIEVGRAGEYFARLRVEGRVTVDDDEFGFEEVGVGALGLAHQAAPDEIEPVLRADLGRRQFLRELREGHILHAEFRVVGAAADAEFHAAHRVGPLMQMCWRRA